MSGQRYGGVHSPGEAGKAARRAETAGSTAPGPRGRTSPFAGRRAMRVDLRARLMFILPAPLLFAALLGIGGGNIAATGLSLTGFACLMFAAWMLAEGQKAARAYAARAVARRPAIPRLIIAALASGLGVALAQLAGTGGPVTAAGFGLVALAAHVAAFGIDPLENKGIDLSDAEHGRVADAIDHAEKLLREIHDDAQGIGDHEIAERVLSLCDEVLALLRRIEQDPRDLTRARRYLSVHLVGAHEATRKYAENHEALDDPNLRADYLALLSELEASFQRGRDKLLADDRTDLEVEIEVLRDRLGQEKA
ncbi:MAG: 5-bromo-4-chloroindolyl phosphate hydrolysis family protein [Pseudomonadota bacterium]